MFIQILNNLKKGKCRIGIIEQVLFLRERKNMVQRHEKSANVLE
jgi:hypothetical protein